ncbi:MAG: hypothetical protein KGY56_11300 [Desulfobacterales bacterium]|nr:hypothetical protein [Desulfobacterales bacterium]
MQMNGLRVSDRLVRLEQVFTDQWDPRLVPLYRKLAADRINISFLYLNYLVPAKQISCLVEPETLTRLTRDSVPGGVEPVKPDASAAAGLVSAFPHRFDPAAIGTMLRAVAQTEIEWHCMASSGSMLAIATDYATQKQAVDAVAGGIGLPENHVPVFPGQDYDPIARSLKTAPETVARYVESKIKTYGIQVYTGLTLCSLRLRADALEKWSRAVSEKGCRFFYACAAPMENERVNLEVLLDAGEPETRDFDIAADTPCADTSPDNSATVREKAEMICFHGPHFGDRYGIADKALGRIAQAGVPVWLAGCVGATVSIVLPPHAAKKATKALSAAFEMPD